MSSVLEDAALGKAMRELSETAQMPRSDGKYGWVFTISSHGGSWHVSARGEPFPRDDEGPGPVIYTGAGATLREAALDAHRKMEEVQREAGE